MFAFLSRRRKAAALLCAIIVGASAGGHTSMSRGDQQGSPAPDDSLSEDVETVARCASPFAPNMKEFVRLARTRYPAWKAAADGGDGRGHYLVGVCRLVGVPCKHSAEMALENFSIAALKEVPAGECALAECFIRGLGGVKKDEVKAVALYRKAAGKGYRWAQHHLARCYRAGVGELERDPHEAFKLELKAAKQGLSVAQTAVGFAYEKGRGVEENVPEAVRWYEQAARQGDPVGQLNLGLMYFRGATGKVEREKGLKLIRAAAAAGSLLAQRYLKEIESKSD